MLLVLSSDLYYPRSLNGNSNASLLSDNASIWRALTIASFAPSIARHFKYTAASPADKSLSSRFLLKWSTSPNTWSNTCKSERLGGVQSDADGMLIFGWVRSGGDLHVPHFFATQLMQIIPVTGLIADRFSQRPRLVVVIASIIGVGMVAFTFLQALRGQPFIWYATRQSNKVVWEIFLKRCSSKEYTYEQNWKI